jgi:hypothetical protein
MPDVPEQRPSRTLRLVLLDELVKALAAHLG